ncbi:hypothetical protein TWF481_002965 [Arthrobotrys musiformis]|uniref:Uncharacterized protein n=1 Tax=Arthrobotrys musiformis TaxID=47236 RepID=A0AAV9VRS4_9PEZI
MSRLGLTHERNITDAATRAYSLQTYKNPERSTLRLFPREVRYKCGESRRTLTQQYHSAAAMVLYRITKQKDTNSTIQEELLKATASDKHQAVIKSLVPGHHS